MTKWLFNASKGDIVAKFGEIILMHLKKYQNINHKSSFNCMVVTYK